jgi:hypothetical protein
MDEFQSFSKGLTSPATIHFAIQPDDAADLPILPRVCVSPYLPQGRESQHRL